jgi:ERCC4-type nuclease
MPIWIDYREKSLLTLSPTGKQFTPPVGDLWIGDLSGTSLLSGGVILERKTVADLEASILDGRYKEQRGRLLAYANEHRVAMGYVIEGPLKGWSGRLAETALRKHITRLLFHHRIPVLQTRNVEETLHMAELIEEQWIQDKGQFSWDSTLGSTLTPVASSYVKSECRDTPTSFLIGTLTQCRGISEALARIIVKQFTTLESILKLTLLELAGVTDPENPKRKVGKAVAERLYGLLHHTTLDLPLRNVTVRMPKKVVTPQECLIEDSA